MSIKAIGIFANKIVDFKAIASILGHFPSHHLYLINPSFPFLEELHQNNVKSSEGLGPIKYSHLIRMCYF